MTRNLILLSLDCVRADCLAPWARPAGWARRMLQALGIRSRPLRRLDSLARSGLSLDGVFTSAPFTPPAHASLFTGRYPQRHGVRLLVGQRMEEDIATLAGRLGQAGYDTAAFPGAFVINSDTGILRGFTYQDDVTEGRWSERGGYWRTGEAVLAAFLQWLDGRRRAEGFFAFLHLFDAHHDGEFDKKEGLTWAEGYYERLRRMDRCVIGGLIQALRQRGMLASTGIVVTADHGESLGEHGEQGHGRTLSDAVLRIPLIYVMPWLEAERPTVVDARLSRIIDVMPTTLSLMGLEPPAALDGVDLSGALLGKQPFPELDAYSETCPIQLYEGDPRAIQPFMGVEKASLRTARWRYNESASGLCALYRIGEQGEDPADVAADHPEAVERMSRRLRELGAWRKPRLAEAPTVLEQEVVQRLKSLGYL